MFAYPFRQSGGGKGCAGSGFGQEPDAAVCLRRNRFQFGNGHGRILVGIERHSLPRGGAVVVIIKGKADEGVVQDDDIVGRGVLVEVFGRATHIIAHQLGGGELGVEPVELDGHYGHSHRP